jgi:hypothetical protein
MFINGLDNLPEPFGSGISVRFWAVGSGLAGEFGRVRYNL